MHSKIKCQGLYNSLCRLWFAAVDTLRCILKPIFKNFYIHIILFFTILLAFFMSNKDCPHTCITFVVLFCRKPPDCHHEKRDPHHCHFGTCPPCKQICGKQLVGCTHVCPARCHQAIMTKVRDTQPRAGPWEGKPATRVEVVAMPCPPCAVPVPVTCLGQHEVRVFSNNRYI